MTETDQLRPTLLDHGITPARLVAIGFDVRPGPQRQQGAIEVQHLVNNAGEQSGQLEVLPLEHRPGFAYLWNIQCRHGRAVVEGDPDLSRIIYEQSFARAHDALLGLIRNGKAGAHGDIILAGSTSRPWTWDASGRARKLLFDDNSRRAFLRLRTHDILWVEDNRLVAAPAEEMPGLANFTKTRSVFTAPSGITMLSRVYGWDSDHLVVTAGREHIELVFDGNAADPRNAPTVGRRSKGTGLFIGHADHDRGFKALASLEARATGGWQLAIYSVADPSATSFITA